MRLSYSITLILALEVAQAAYSSQVPKCDELLWIQLYALICYTFCYISLVETVIVVHIASCTTEHLLMPRWLVELVYGSPGERMHKELDLLSRNEHGSVATDPRRMLRSTSPLEQTLDYESAAHLLFRYYNSSELVQPPSRVDRPQHGPEAATPSSSLPTPEDTLSFIEENGVRRASRKLHDGDNVRMLFFEALFYDFDVSNDGSLDLQEAKRALAFLAFRLPPLDRIKRIREADDGDGVSGGGRLKRSARAHAACGCY